MRNWVGVSAGLAPVALIGGWSLAAARQPAHYNSMRDTISALAAQHATDRWIMTAALALLGACHLATAAGLTEVGAVARAVLGIGGIATMLVAASPQPNAAHVPVATLAFLALALWPAFSVAPSRRTGLLASAALLILLAWLAVELRNGTALGLSERALAGAQALCPLLFVLTTRSTGRPVNRYRAARR